MTALSSLIKYLLPFIDRSKIGDVALHNIVEEHIEMEKEQIMMAVKDSWYMAKGSNFQEPQEEQYYNEKYK